MEAGFFNKDQMKHLAVGVVVAYAITSIAFLGFAMLITYTNMSERSLPMVVMVTTVLSVLVAGFDAARGATSRGWLWGMVAGFVYVLIMAIIMVILLPSFTVDMRTVLVSVLGIAGGGLGGVIGINLKK
ncbi:MAG: TIGR04086 family membrane protein [Defluviitaleaceae bacterium]|nr:TIGR04086 family membrane protein [Defluviitaleaceae bacterium]